jgi:hypothetical protein
MIQTWAEKMKQEVTEKELVIALWDCQKFVSLLPTKKESDVIRNIVVDTLARWVVQQKAKKNLTDDEAIDLQGEVMGGGTIEKQAQKAWEDHWKSKKHS